MLTHSPSAILFSRIKAELIANGTPFADASAEVAFRTWLQTAWADSGYTSDFAVLYQPATSTTFSVGVRVGTAGHNVNVWWGDGTSNSYSPSTSSNTTVSKTYGSAAKRPVVILGRITRWASYSQAHGGRLWENLRSLTYLECWNCSQLIGSIDSLPAGLTFLSCWGCPQLIGSIDNLPAGLAYIDCGGCSQLIGSIDNLPSGLTAISCSSCSLLTGSINSLPAGLTFISCSSCSLLTGSINSLPAGLTYLNCSGCSFTYPTTSGTRTWVNNMRHIYLSPPSAGIVTSAMVDALLIDLSAVATWVTEKLIYAAGNCATHTSASNAAITTIQGKGVTVTVN